MRNRRDWALLSGWGQSLGVAFLSTDSGGKGMAGGSGLMWMTLLHGDLEQEQRRKMSSCILRRNVYRRMDYICLSLTRKQLETQSRDKGIYTWRKSEACNYKSDPTASTT